jgi:hypothetical protein
MSRSTVLPENLAPRWRGFLCAVISCVETRWALRVIVPARPRGPQSQDAMGQHGAHVREVERPLALVVGELDLALRQVRARLNGQPPQARLRAC